MPICVADVMKPLDEHTDSTITLSLTVVADISVQDAAYLMYDKGVTRLPVVERGTGRRMGIVRQADLLAAFSRPAEEIREEVRHEIIHYVLGWNPAKFKVEVDQGVVKLAGHLERSSMIDRLLDEVENVDGVVAVEHQLTCETTDSDTAPVG